MNGVNAMSRSANTCAPPQLFTCQVTVPNRTPRSAANRQHDCIRSRTANQICRSQCKPDRRGLIGHAGAVADVRREVDVNRPFDPLFGMDAAEFGVIVRDGARRATPNFRDRARLCNARGSG